MKKDIPGYDGVRRYQVNGKWAYYCNRSCIPPEVILGHVPIEDYFRSLFPDYDKKKAGDPVKIEHEKKEMVHDEYKREEIANRLKCATDALILKGKNPKLTQKELVIITGLYRDHTESLEGAQRMLRRLWKELEKKDTKAA